LKNLFLVICITCTAFTLNAQTYKTYKSESMSIQYPEGWKAEPNEAPVEFFISSPLAGKEDGFMENVNLVKEPTELSLQDYIALNKENLAGILSAKITAEGEATLGKQKAAYLVYEFTYGDKALKTLAYFIVVKGKAYVLTCSASPASYDTYLATFKKMAQSIVMR
jgi:hypothetical protein